MFSQRGFRQALIVVAEPDASAQDKTSANHCQQTANLEHGFLQAFLGLELDICLLYSQPQTTVYWSGLPGKIFADAK